MNKKILLLAILTSSCAPVINYQLTSVPEEGGIKFVQLTTNEENVVGPNIFFNKATNVLQWYAAPFISVTPDGLRLAFVAQKNDKRNLYIKNTTGGKATVQRTFREGVLDMAFSPDGTRIAFTDAIVTGTTQGIGGSIGVPITDSNIYQINATDGAAVQQVTTTGLDEMGPNFSRDGKSVFFTKKENDRYYIWNVNLETSILTQYTEGFTPSLTPDGNKMVITRNNRGRGEIWLIDLKSGSETLILNDSQKGYSSPQVSPDGQTIVCVGSTPGTSVIPTNLNIYTVTIEGTKIMQLTFHPGHDTSPVWAPDGNSIYFISQRGNETGKANVWRMDRPSN